MASGTRHQYVNPYELGNQEYGVSGFDDDQSKPVRACQRCRDSKVRCVQSNPSQPCVRCEKAGRPCFPTKTSNKRRRHSGGRSIDEIEATLAALTYTLSRQSRKGSDKTGESTTAAGVAAAAPQLATAVFSGVGDPSGALSGSIPLLPNPDLRTVAPSALACTASLSASSDDSTPHIKALIGEIISDDIASTIFEEFITNMLPEFPFIAFSKNTNAHDVWNDAPITFLAILDAAADGFCELGASRRLRKFLIQIYGTCLLGTSAFSFPLLQALIISAVWHRAIEPTEPGEQMDVYQLSHAAANMAIIMGLGKSLKAQTWSSPMPTQARKLRGPASIYQASSLDTRRLWLGCHYICSNTSMALQTPNIMRWTRYMDECLEVLDMSPTSHLSDKVLCLHIRLQHIIEDFELQHSSATPGSTASGVIHRAFRRQLATWASAPRVWNDSLKFSQHFVALYMHEVAMYSAPSADDPSGSETTNINPAEFTDCLAAAHGVLDVFLTLDMSHIRALPTLYFVRLTYAVIVLVKLHFAAARLPDQRDAAQQTLKIKANDYLGRMLQKFSGWGTLWPAWKITKSFRKVRDSFRQDGNKEMTVPELAWLDLWAFKKSSGNLVVSRATAPPVEQAIDAESARSTQSTDLFRQETYEAQPLEVTEESAPAAQMLPTSGGNDLTWDLSLATGPDEAITYATHDALPSMIFDDSVPWNTTQLDTWFDTDVNTSTFDFDGDLQSTIQYFT